jgi:hypothetical protein
MSSKKHQRGIVIPSLKPRNPFHDHPAMKKSHGHKKGRVKDDERRAIMNSLNQEE